MTLQAAKAKPLSPVSQRSVPESWLAPPSRPPQQNKQPLQFSGFSMCRHERNVACVPFFSSSQFIPGEHALLSAHRRAMPCVPG
jgi:hypothetical protein